MDNNFLPAKDADLLAWSTNFSTLATANYASYGLTTGQASTYAGLHTAFASALALAVAASTRTKTTVAAKNSARTSLVNNARLLAGIVRAYPAITAGQLNSLQLTVRDRNPTPIGPPSTSPIITPLNSSAASINFRFSDETTPDSRSRPFGAVGLQVFCKVGETPPAGIADCVFRGMYTKNTNGPGSRAALIDFDDADVGKTAYFIGQWINRRGEAGPQSALAQMTIAA